MLGLQVAQKDTMIENMVLDFAQLIQDFGHIPSGNRSYYMSRSQPPFFSLMVELLAETKKDNDVLGKYLPQLQKEYQYWMASETSEDAQTMLDKQKNREKAYRKTVFIEADHLFNRYYDDADSPRPEAYKEDVLLAKKSKRNLKSMYRHLRSGAESGWDFSSRWLKDGQNLESIHTTDIAPVDLNALMYHLEMTLARAFDVKKQFDYVQTMRDLANKRKGIYDKYFWNEEAGFYFDYDFVERKQKNVYSLAACYPLFFKMATPEQAQKVAKVLETQFLQVGGLSATLVKSGQKWDAPNGFAPLQWIAIQGLRNYGLTDLANKIKKNWVENNLRVYKNTGKLLEKYNVYDLSLPNGGGEYPAQDGFGYTNGVLLKLLSEKE